MLEEPVRIGNVELRNRLVMAPTYLGAADPASGNVSPRQLEYCRRRTQGRNVGLAVVEHSYVSDDGRAAVGQVSAAHDGNIPGLAALARVIHQSGTTALLQLSHAGALTPPNAVATEGVSPSGILMGRGMQRTHAASPEELDLIVKAFAAAALRARSAGFDGVELHAAHGYLLSEFYSPLTNHRGDQYGGTLEGRLLLTVRTVSAVRDAVGPSMLVGIRFGACDYVEGGSTLQEAGRAACILQKTGIDYLGISGGLCGPMRQGVRTPGYFGDASAVVRANVDIPVILTGGIRAREDAEAVLQDGKADLVGVARGFMRNERFADETMAASREGDAR